MNDLRIEGTQSTPSIVADARTGTVEMSGDSYPENSFELFSPVLQWIEAYLRDTQHALTLNLHLLYLNTSSVKAMMDIFDMLEDAHREGREVAVNWFYDEQNERVAELAEEFKEDCSFPFMIASQVE
ncbi:MAG TPA: biofilm regulation phosphoprotein SiaC [Noviherbaspirillum sp.]|uniref:biofilm regulation phosphoprotein SiaC n=1 Tax=Noviherbaspirillum sp. TaxID=1926288 RepID=UPI002B487B8B|nr:biofilm regulation phosphoprotein SiaC [Noviherbaspirillum sp.]HJV87413.1 biofilm regulation phosphoprotein SiaC [Noviherbaspirillum sp.]